jgi:HSP20 family protein
MTVVRWEPLAGATALDRLFGTFFDTHTAARPAEPGATARRWSPPMDIAEAGDHFVVRADLPGLAEDAVQVEVQDNTLTISGTREARHEAEQEGFYRVERAMGSFRRSVSLPEGIDPDAIAATFDRGVLEIRIPKPAERQPRRVAIRVGAPPAIEEATAEGGE